MNGGQRDIGGGGSRLWCGEAGSEPCWSCHSSYSVVPWGSLAALLLALMRTITQGPFILSVCSYTQWRTKRTGALQRPLTCNIIPGQLHTHSRHLWSSEEAEMRKEKTEESKTFPSVCALLLLPGKQGRKEEGKEVGKEGGGREVAAAAGCRCNSIWIISPGMENWLILAEGS